MQLPDLPSAGPVPPALLLLEVRLRTTTDCLLCTHTQPQDQYVLHALTDQQHAQKSYKDTLEKSGFLQHVYQCITSKHK